MRHHVLWQVCCLACLGLLLGWAPVRAEDEVTGSLPVPKTVSPADLQQVMKSAAELQKADGDLEPLLDREINKAAAKAEKAPAVSEKATTTTTAKPESEVGDGVQDMQQALKTQEAVTKTVQRFQLPRFNIWWVLIGLAIVASFFALTSVQVIRFFARRITTAFDALDTEHPMRASSVRYSWYYRDAVSRLPEYTKSRRR